MFGHQDNHHDDQQVDENAHHEPQHDGVLENGDGAQNETQNNPALPSDLGTFGAANDDTVQSDDNQPTEAPASEDEQPASEPVADPQPVHNDDLLDSGPANDLLDIKLQALKQLTPLVDHLDQSPEEKFRTTMMMIQASDDQSLVKLAYEAAKDIADEKARAQALLDIVNEINYFTHQGTGEA